MKDIYTWEKALASLKYQTELFDLRIKKDVYSLLVDIVMVFFLWFMMWDWAIWVVSKWDWGQDWRGNGTWCLNDWYVQYPAFLMFTLFGKLFDMLLHIPWHYWETFKIDAKYGFSEATCCTFLCERIASFLEFTLIEAPLNMLIAVAVQYTGNYLVLYVLVFTPIIKFAIIYIYPFVIMPLYSTFTPFPTDTEENKALLVKI